MHFPQVCALALVVVFAAGFTNAASIKKTEAFEKQTMQEKGGKESKEGGNPDEEEVPADQSATDKKKPQKGMDIDQDGKISDEEYAAFLKRREEEYKNELREELKETVKDFDKNGDGKLQQDEVVQMLAATRNLRPKIDFKPIFAELDGDSDGSLNMDELEYFMQNTPWNLLEEIPSSEMAA